jgi:hypothetical protein
MWKLEIIVSELVVGSNEQDNECISILFIIGGPSIPKNFCHQKWTGF